MVVDQLRARASMRAAPADAREAGSPPAAGGDAVPKVGAARCRAAAQPAVPCRPCRPDGVAARTAFAGYSFCIAHAADVFRCRAAPALDVDSGRRPPPGRSVVLADVGMGRAHPRAFRREGLPYPPGAAFPPATHTHAFALAPGFIVPSRHGGCHLPGTPSGFWSARHARTFAPAMVSTYSTTTPAFRRRRRLVRRFPPPRRAARACLLACCWPRLVRSRSSLRH